MSRLPESVQPRASDRAIIALTLLAVLAVACLLEIWRPFFYLTDDSLSGFFPVAIDTSRALWGGRSITVNTHLFGGSYYLLQDASSICLWSPWLFLFSPLALTRHYVWIVDAIALANSCTIAAAFAGSMLFLRRRLNLATSDQAIVIAALSYTFTPYNLLVGSSWIGFLNAQAVFPIALAASYAKRWWMGSLWLAPAFIFALVGGHLHTTIMAAFFGGLMVAMLAVARRSWAPLLAFGGGGLLAVLVISPLLWPAVQGFGGSGRSEGMPAAAAAALNVPALRLVESFVFGPLAGLWSEGIPIFKSEPRFCLGLAFSLVNIPTMAAVGIALWTRRINPLAWALLAMFAVMVGWIIHPGWLAELHVSLPLLKSLRWPFRELSILLFVVHVLFVLYVPLLRELTGPLRVAILTLGAGSLALIGLNPAPSLNELAIDRHLILSGEASRYWSKLRAESPKPLKIVVGANQTLITYSWERFPFSVLGAYNYAALFDVVNVSGYAVTMPESQRTMPVTPAHWSGIFRENHAQAVAKHVAGVTLVTVRSVATIRWTVATPAGDRWFRLDEETGSIIEETGPPAIVP